MSVYSIKDLEQLSGIKAHTIRIWEQRYQIFSPKRTATNIRFYNDEDLKLILNIASLQHFGYKISKIVKMTWAERQEEVRNLSVKNQSYDDQVNELSVSMIDLDETYFNQIIDTSISQIGLEKTMMEIIYPFLQKIGVLWITNSINPAQEHFISHLVRQKLIVLTNELLPAKNNSPLFVLFLPDGELHELGLLFANYMIRSRGIKTLFFGQIVPLSALEEVYQEKKPEFMFTCITANPGASDIQAYVNSISEKFKDTKILVTGPQAVNNGLKSPKNVKILSHFHDLIDIVEAESKSKSASI
ncbi:MAG: MerR family transcriptional regulator [Ekhidna sp.]